MVRFLCLAILLVCPGILTAGESVEYARDIKPLLKERCFACHGALQQKGKLRLDSGELIRKGGRSGPALVPGAADRSLLVEKVTAEEGRMPPEGEPLTAQQIALLRAWIDQGASFPSSDRPQSDPRTHWAFRPPVRPPVPVVKQSSGASNPIDAFVAARSDEHRPGPPAEKQVLLRRVYLDLIGLPPTRAELHAFLADEAPDAYERVVDRLLARPEYAERWARHWMDVWRYSDWYGRRAVPDVLNSYAMIWRWRDWIIQCLAEDRGYDRMVTAMLAADEVAPTDAAELVATGFVVRNFFRWNYEQWKKDLVEHTGKAFLGLTLNCCHCHDHKYDPITQEEYFRFRAFFEPLELRHDRVAGEPDPGPYPTYDYGKAYGPIKSGMVRVMDLKLDAPTYMYEKGDARNRMPGRPPVTPGVPAILGGTLRIEPVKLPAEAWYPGLKPFVQQEEITRREAALAAAKEPQIAAARAELAAIQARIAADRARYQGGPGDAEQLARAAGKAERQANLQAARAAGDAKQLAATEKALSADSTGYTPLSPQYPPMSTGRRAALAAWIVSRENPLTARVAVNHLWSWHFGRPLVETVYDFGLHGKPPSHPELLDWLAVEFMENGWHMKPLHRLMVTSQAYRRSSRGIPQAVRRMEAEVVRDSLLYLSGALDETRGGPEIPQEQGLISRRRSLYFAHHGEASMPFLQLFDVASACDGYRRSTSVVPQQALALHNSELTLRSARLLARRLAPEAAEAESFIRAAFEQVLGRAPSAAEVAASRAFLSRQVQLYRESGPAPPASDAPASEPGLRAGESLVHVLFNHNDFVTIR